MAGFETFRADRIARIVALGGVLAGAPLAVAEDDRSAFAIVAPRADDLLYGPTELRWRGDSSVEYLAEVVRGPGATQEICRRRGPPGPGECVFDAGRDLSAEEIVIYAFGAQRTPIATQRVTTAELLEPDATVEAGRRIEVLARAVGDDDWVRRLVSDPARLGCTLGGRACRVKRIARVAPRGRLHLMVLIDESGSTGEPNADLAGGLQILRRELLDAAGPDSGFDTSLTLSAFSGAVRALADRPVESQAEIAAALARIRPEGTTSLYRSMLQVLEPMVRAQERARLGGSDDRFVLIVLSDGNDTDSSSPPIARLMELAMSGGVPIYLLVLPSSGTERSFLALGPCSGGDTFLRTADPRRLMHEELLQALLARVTIEIDADPTIRFHKPRGLSLKAPPGGTLRHPDLVMPERSPQEIAIELAADPEAQQRARLAALQRLAQDASELEVAERLVDLLLAASNRQEPEPWRDGVRQALALISGRILLWKANDDTQRLALIRLLERARDRAWGGGPRPALLSRVLATFLDPDFPATRALRDRAARL